MGGRTTYRADVGSGGGVETEGLEEKAKAERRWVVGSGVQRATVGVGAWQSACRNPTKIFFSFGCTRS